MAAASERPRDDRPAEARPWQDSAIRAARHRRWLYGPWIVLRLLGDSGFRSAYAVERPVQIPNSDGHRPAGSTVPHPLESKAKRNRSPGRLPPPTATKYTEIAAGMDKGV